MAALDAAHGAHAGPVFVDDAGRRARIVRLAAIAGALALLAFITMVTASVVGASWVPKLSLRVPGPPPTRLAVGPRLTAPTRPDGAGASAGASASVPTTSIVARSAAPVAQVPLVTSPPTTIAAPLSPSTTAPGHSSTTLATSPSVHGLSHKKASTGTTTSVP